MIVLNLPYPLSANKYWRPVHVGGHISIVPTKDAKNYREQIGWMCKAAGVTKPLMGRVKVHLQLWPNRPLDYKKRMREHGAAWDDTVMCIDLTNAEKVLLDALNGLAFEDDKRIWQYSAERMEPDEHGARVVLRIEQLAQPVAVHALQDAFNGTHRMTRRIYIAGPMTGLPELNFPAFHATAADLRAKGWEVVNPAEINADPTAGWLECMRADIQQLVMCDAVCVLPGWGESRGASLEVTIAQRLGFDIYAPDRVPQGDLLGAVA